MKEETSWKQFLTEEVLKETWHESKITENCSCSCGRPYHLGTPYDHYNRTFDNRSDMMDLYEAIFKEGNSKWKDFTFYILTTRGTNQTPYIFCFDGKNYEDRCKLVAEFYGYKEEEYNDKNRYDD